MWKICSYLAFLNLHFSFKAIEMIAALSIFLHLMLDCILRFQLVTIVNVPSLIALICQFQEIDIDEAVEM